MGGLDLDWSVELMARQIGYHHLIVNSVSVCACVDGDREEVERHLCADYSFFVTGGRRVRARRLF